MIGNSAMEAFRLRSQFNNSSKSAALLVTEDCGGSGAFIGLTTNEQTRGPIMADGI
jgi:hypothetical protein